MSFTNEQYNFFARLSSSQWELLVEDRTTRKKHAEFGISGWNDPSTLRSLWGKPTGRDQNNWLHWEHPAK